MVTSLTLELGRTFVNQAVAPTVRSSGDRGLYFDEFHLGQSWVSPARTITDADLTNFAGISGDFNPLHTDEEFAQKTQFGGRIFQRISVG